MKIAGMDRDFVVIGENVHTTRSLLRRGKRIVADGDGNEVIGYTTAAGEERSLPIPEAVKATQDYQEGRVKHVAVAMRAAMTADGAAAEEGLCYLRALVEKQQQAGADYLDLNVDEFTIKPDERIAAMAWLAEAMAGIATTSLAIDSSDIDVIAAGLAVCAGRAGRAMLNSASLERPAALDLALEHLSPVIVTAAGERGMPDGVEGRVENASRMVDAALEKGIAIGDIHIDPLVFPVSVDPAFGRHCLDAIRQLRGRYGVEIHIAGGASNASFGIPARKYVNQAFLRLSVEAGANGGIMDPVLNPPAAALDPDADSHALRLATDVVLGQDPDCATYIKAWRKKELTG
ncbi:MAG: dihydropteroate synthase [Alphaproteobacteria bacterium]|jgi:5-methyltetrahydrofolate--homocysteine methyltransferase|nr:dihydropteroate synthase [Alphaproteobacteria bacterium]MDP6565429.1 dihydropteroate synthase [Alphaproteobacteria bacterium]MDP6815011.1 dihydropteroate synthase [Alphaproteobacteria bacterium]